MARKLSLLIITPVFNDWSSVRMLSEQIGRLRLNAEASLLVVDDGSTKERPTDLLSLNLGYLQRVFLLRLKKNFGHQRAIALALSYVCDNLSFDAVLVMDCDGEDRPQDIPHLLDAFENSGRQRVCFARREDRSESRIFKVFYSIYLMAARVLVGSVQRIGNFSILPWEALNRLAVSQEIWLHYASAVMRSKLPYETISLSRGTRFSGSSKMSIEDLIVHGFQAIAVHREVVAVRIFLFCLSAATFLLAGMSVVVGIRFLTTLAIPGWATMLAGILTILLGQILGLALYAIFLVLGGRSAMHIVPLRDYQFFVSSFRELDP